MHVVLLLLGGFLPLGAGYLHFCPRALVPYGILFVPGQEVISQEVELRDSKENFVVSK